MRANTQEGDKGGFSSRSWTDSSMLQDVLVTGHGLARVRLVGDALRAAFQDEPVMRRMSPAR